MRLGVIAEPGDSVMTTPRQARWSACNRPKGSRGRWSSDFAPRSPVFQQSGPPIRSCDLADGLAKTHQGPKEEDAADAEEKEHLRPDHVDSRAAVQDGLSG